MLDDPAAFDEDASSRTAEALAERVVGAAAVDEATGVASIALASDSAAVLWTAPASGGGGSPGGLVRAALPPAPEAEPACVDPRAPAAAAANFGDDGDGPAAGGSAPSVALSHASFVGGRLLVGDALGRVSLYCPSARPPCRPARRAAPCPTWRPRAPTTRCPRPCGWPRCPPGRRPRAACRGRRPVAGLRRRRPGGGAVGVAGPPHGARGSLRRPPAAAAPALHPVAAGRRAPACWRWPPRRRRRRPCFELPPPPPPPGDDGETPPLPPPVVSLVCGGCGPTLAVYPRDGRGRRVAGGEGVGGEGGRGGWGGAEGSCRSRARNPQISAVIFPSPFISSIAPSPHTFLLRRPPPPPPPFTTHHHLPSPAPPPGDCQPALAAGARGALLRVLRGDLLPAGLPALGRHCAGRRRPQGRVLAGLAACPAGCRRRREAPGGGAAGCVCVCVCVYVQHAAERRPSPTPPPLPPYLSLSPSQGRGAGGDRVRQHAGHSACGRCPGRAAGVGGGGRRPHVRRRGEGGALCSGSHPLEGVVHGLPSLSLPVSPQDVAHGLTPPAPPPPPLPPPGCRAWPWTPAGVCCWPLMHRQGVAQPHCRPARGAGVEGLPGGAGERGPRGAGV
jgi:hypothetical protein